MFNACVRYGNYAHDIESFYTLIHKYKNVRDNDYDYLDSQLLLQDVAYYPLGSPSASGKGLHIAGNREVTVAGILASLMDMASEGED